MTNTFFFVDSDGTENVSNIEPHRTSEGFWTVEQKINSSFGDKIPIKTTIYDALVELPKGTIEKLFGKSLTYLDNPIRVI